VIDVAAVIGQIQGMVEQLISAVQFVFGVCRGGWCRGALRALQATHDEREKELSILRTLGARNAQLRSALLAEFAVLGAVSGALAGVGATGIGWALGRIRIQAALLAQRPAGGWRGRLPACAVVMLAGWLGTRHLLARPPLASLRALS
jgi:putative ABC transport system permease protein